MTQLMTPLVPIAFVLGALMTHWFKAENKMLAERGRWAGLLLWAGKRHFTLQIDARRNLESVLHHAETVCKANSWDQVDLTNEYK